MHRLKIYDLGLLLVTHWRQWWESTTSTVVSLLVAALLSGSIGWIIYGQRQQDERIQALQIETAKINTEVDTIKILLIKHDSK